VLRKLLLVAVAVASSAEAQPVRVPLVADSTPEQIVARLFQRGGGSAGLNPDNVIGILTQRGRAQVPAKLDRLADLLVDVALAARTGDANRQDYEDAITSISSICSFRAS
jgi:hypothetical protein